jgi:hypothetical protein
MRPLENRPAKADEADGVGHRTNPAPLEGCSESAVRCSEAVGGSVRRSRLAAERRWPGRGYDSTFHDLLVPLAQRNGGRDDER